MSSSDAKTDPDDQQTIEKIMPVTTLEDCDAVIASNAGVQISVSIAMLVLFFIFRKKTPWVYYPNIKNKIKHPCYQENVGFFSWMLPLFSIDDTQLLSISGLDGFMFLQTIKLLYRICLIMCISIVPGLCYWFYQFKSPERLKEVFISLSIWKIKSKAVFFTILVSTYLISLLIFYLVFIYYKRYVTLRQLYLTAPASMTSVMQLKKVSKELGSDQNALDYVNASAKSVLINRLPAEIHNDEGLKLYLESLKLGEIESVSLVHDTYNLQKMYEKRDEIIQDIEKEIALTFVKIKEYYAEHKEECLSSFGEFWTSELEKDTLSLFQNMKFLIEDKVRIFNDFCKYGHNFFTRTPNGKTLIDLHLLRLRTINEKIKNEKLRLNDENKEELIDIPPASEQLFVESNIQEDVGFFKMSQIINIRKNKDLFTLDLPIKKKRAFVTFKDQKTAGLIRQIKLGSRAFSSSIDNAPSPNDVLWRSITKNEVSSFFFKIISLAMYIVFIGAFLFIVVKIIESLQVKNNEQNLIFSIFKVSEKFAKVYEGIMVPLVYNILLFFVPIIIKSLIHMEDIYSYSGTQVKLMYRFSLFLFFNAFLATFATSCIVQYNTRLGDGNFTVTEILASLSKSVIKSSVFFFNTIVQRLCIGSMITVLKPSPFLYNLILAPVVIFTRRQEKERTFSPPMDFGNHIPNLLLIFPMTLVYSCFCPLILVVSFLFFFVSYIVYKNELIYATRNDFESGGSYWKPTVKFILFSLVTFQITNCIVTYTENFFIIFMAYLPLIFLTVIFTQGLDIIFEESSEKFPLNAPEEKYLDRFSKKALQVRHKILSEWEELDEEEDEDAMPISDLGYEDSKVEVTDSFYKDPSLLTSIGTIYLPHNFYKIAHYLKTFDKNNLFGLKN